MADVFERRRAQLRDPRAGPRIAEGFERGDARRGQLLDLRARDAGDADEVVVLLPLPLTQREEVADPTVLDRVGVGVGPRGDSVEEPLPDPPVVGHVVARPEGLALTEPVDDVHGVGHPALNPRDLLGVEAKLEHVSRPSVPFELGVNDLVGTVRQTDDEVRHPAPVAIEEGRLVDDVCAAAHRPLGLAGHAVPIPAASARVLDVVDVASLAAKPTQVGLLVLLTFAADEIGVPIDAKRPLKFIARDSELKRRQVRAREEGAERGQ
jgi:hypothetical protein